MTWVEYLTFGSLLTVILLVRPQGIRPEKPSATLETSRIERIMAGASGAEVQRREEEDDEP